MAVRIYYNVSNNSKNKHILVCLTYKRHINTSQWLFHLNLVPKEVFKLITTAYMHVLVYLWLLPYITLHLIIAKLSMLWPVQHTKGVSIHNISQWLDLF